MCRKTPVSQLLQSGQRVPLTQPLCSIPIFNWLDEVHSPYGGQSTSLNLLIQIWISCTNTLTNMPRMMFDHMSGHPVAQSSWHIKSTMTRLTSDIWTGPLAKPDTWALGNLNQIFEQVCGPGFLIYMLSLPPLSCYYGDSAPAAPTTTSQQYHLCSMAVFSSSLYFSLILVSAPHWLRLLHEIHMWPFPCMSFGF